MAESAEPQLPSFWKIYSEVDRGLNAHRRWLRFSPENLAIGSRVLVVGSGATRLFEEQLHEQRPDLKITSVDPLLRDGVHARIEIGNEQALQGDPNFFDPKHRWRQPNNDNTYRLLDGHYYKPGAVAVGITETSIHGGTKNNDLPFPDDIFNVVLGLHSVTQYGSPERGLEESIRVLKPGGKGHFYPVYDDDMPLFDQVFGHDVTITDQHTFLTGVRDARLVVFEKLAS